MKVGIIGNGFVGSALIQAFRLKSEILVYDIQDSKSNSTLEKVSKECDFVFVCLPTPMNVYNNGIIDTKIIEDVFEKISSSNSEAIYVIKSTVVPGTTKQLEMKYPNLKIVFNPEFLTERSAHLDFINAPRIVIGGEESLAKKLEDFYRIRFPYKNIIITDSTSAEFSKYMCNCFFATKISFMNEMKQACLAVDADWFRINQVFSTDGRIGNSHLEVPGHDGNHGFGGKCFPKDINAFINYFLQIGVKPTMLQAAWEKNLEVREEHDWHSIEGAVTKEIKND